MKRILTFVVLCLALSLNVFAGSIHKVEVTPLQQIPILNSKDFMSANVSGAGEKAVLSIKLTDEAAKRMKAFTAKNVGKELPFSVDGKIVRTPVVRVPLEGSAFQVDPLDRTLADEIAQFINSRK